VLKTYENEKNLLRKAKQFGGNPRRVERSLQRSRIELCAPAVPEFVADDVIERKIACSVRLPANSQVLMRCATASSTRRLVGYMPCYLPIYLPPLR
jgi:hypothetical protein